jgi:hypothetical protein
MIDDVVIFFLQATAQTFFTEQICKLYCPGVTFSPAQIFFVESGGEKSLIFTLIIILCLSSYPLSTALSYALVVDAMYDGYAMFKHAKLGLEKQPMLFILLIKVLGAVLGLNNGFGTVKQDYVIKALSGFWTCLGFFGIVDPTRAIKSFGTQLPWFSLIVPYQHSKTINRADGSGCEDENCEQRAVGSSTVPRHISLVL